MATYAGLLLPPLLVGARTFRSAPVVERCLVRMKLLNVDGTPHRGLLVAFHNLWRNPRLSLSAGTAMMTGQRVSVTTDENGYAEIYLLRGAEVQVVVTATTFTRRITVPNAPFAELTDLVSTAPDQFEVIRASVGVDAPRFTP